MREHGSQAQLYVELTHRLCQGWQCHLTLGLVFCGLFRACTPEPCACGHAVCLRLNLEPGHAQCLSKLCKWCLGDEDTTLAWRSRLVPLARAQVSSAPEWNRCYDWKLRGFNVRSRTSGSVPLVISTTGSPQLLELLVFARHHHGGDNMYCSLVDLPKASLLPVTPSHALKVDPSGSVEIEFVEPQEDFCIGLHEHVLPQQCCTLAALAHMVSSAHVKRRWSTAIRAELTSPQHPIQLTCRLGRNAPLVPVCTKTT